MWFRQRNPPNERDSFRMGSFRNRIRPKKTAPIADTKEPANVAVTTKPVTVAPVSRNRDDVSGLPRSRSGRRPSVLSDDDDGAKEKNKALRSDNKYKKNRVTKSASRTRVPDLKVEKSNSNKTVNCVNGQRKLSSAQLIDPTPVKAKQTQRNSTLNFNALLRYKSFISGSTKKLTPDDFERMRRKSLADTGKVRRKSNPDSENGNGTENECEAKTNEKNHLQPTQSVESEKSIDDVFHSCGEDQVDDPQLVRFPATSENGFDTSSNPTTVKKGRNKYKKKGFYLII